MYDKNEESLDAETRGKLLIMGDWNAVVGKERLASMYLQLRTRHTKSDSREEVSLIPQKKANVHGKYMVLTRETQTM